MARGRMLNRSVSFSIKFNRLPDDSCRLLATWLIPHLDYRGVFYADADLVKGQVMPMRADLTLERIEHYLLAMEQAGLLTLFVVEERRWMFWPGFTHNQTLRAGKEKSEFPLPPADGQQSNMTANTDSPPTGGPRADNGRPIGGSEDAHWHKNASLREEKRREEKDIAAKPASAISEHNTSMSDATKPSSDSEPTTTATPIPQTDRSNTGDALQNIFDRAMQAKANPALVKVRSWNLPAHLEGICEDYVDIAKGTPVKASDKGLFLAGAKDIHDLFAAAGKTYSKAWMVKAIETANWSHAHPRALDKAFRELFKLNWKPAGAPANDGTVHVGWVQNERGEMVEQVRKVTTHV